MIVLCIGSSVECSDLEEGKEYEVVAKDIHVFETVYKLKDIEGWWNGKYFRELPEQEDPEPFAEF